MSHYKLPLIRTRKKGVPFSCTDGQLKYNVKLTISDSKRIKEGVHNPWAPGRRDN